MDIKNTDLAYVGGYFDGEACIRWSSYSPKIAIQSCNPNPLKFICNLFNTGNKVILDNRRTSVGKPVYRLEYYGVNAINILSQVSPYMIEKKSQAEKLIQMFSLKEEIKAEKNRRHK